MTEVDTLDKTEDKWPGLHTTVWYTDAHGTRVFCTGY